MLPPLDSHSADAATTAPAGCVPNIGPEQRRRRLHAGIVLALASAVIALLLFTLSAPRPARLILFPPLVAAAICYFQWRDHT